MKIKSIIPILVVIILTLALRLVLLDKIPTGISDDELDYVLNVKAVFLSGKDITGTWSPLSLTPPPGEYPKAELPYLIMSPFIGSMNLSLFAARLPYALFSVLFVVLLYSITNKLLGKNYGFAVGLVAAINPWSIYFGRTAFEAPLATLFYLSAFYWLLLAKGWKILFALPFLFLGFFTYIGAKVTMLPFIFITCFFAWRFINQKQYQRQYISVCLLSLVLAFSFIFYPTKNFNRSSEIINLNHPAIIQRVNNERKLSVTTPFNTLFINKPVILVKESIEKFLGFYSTQFLFLYGDSRSTFSVWSHGMFYFIDIIFLLVGISTLYQKHKRIFYLIAGMLLIGPLPTVLSTTGVTYPLRSSLVFPFLIFVIGVGIWQCIQSSSVKQYKNKVIILLGITYVILLANFMHIYLFRNPIYNSEGFGFSGRIVAKYAALAENTSQPVAFIENETINTIPKIYKQYLFYTNVYTKNTYKQIQTAINNADYTYKNVSVINCPTKPFSKTTTVITDPNMECKTVEGNGKSLTIAQLSDGGTIYNIFNDRICSKYNLHRYPSNITMRDFDVERLSEEEFCTTFITKF